MQSLDRALKPLTLAFLISAGAAGLAQAQDTKKADGVFDDEPVSTKKDEAPKKEEAKKEDAAKKADASKKEDAAKKGDATKKADPKAPGQPATRETIGFNQQTAASQMTELEERMYRLSEALQSLEPENASRLRLALKFSREELILEQMRETTKVLEQAQLSKAESEVRELLAKLEHLRQVLVAEDLDFQLKLTRLRQIRESMAQLDRIVQEERRELGWSRFAEEQRQAKGRLEGRKPDLARLVAEQGSVVEATRALAKSDADPGAKEKERAALAERETKARDAASSLANDPIFADYQPSKLRQVNEPLLDATDKLKADKDAMPGEESALEILKGEMAALDERTAQAEHDVADTEFRRRQSDQEGNRRAADSLAASSSRLGDAGVPLQKDLIRAGASMEQAEKQLGQSAAVPAATDQTAALDTLTKAEGELSSAAEKLLTELRSELLSRLVTELTEMQEAQNLIRETTQAQAPRVAAKSRSALIQLAGLSQKENAMAERMDHLTGLVEETEFGIALPTTLKVLSREMKIVGVWLKDGDASAKTIGMEQRIEDDILTLLQAIRRLPPTTPPPPGTPLPSDPRARERELNRLVAELKMIRLLQVRLNDDTLDVDKNRPGVPSIPPNLKRDMEALESTQEEIRDSLSKIAERIAQPN